MPDLIKYFKKNNGDISRVISHLSFGFLVLFIGLNHNFSFEKDFNLKAGEKKVFNEYSVKFKSLKLENFNNYKAVVGDFVINNSKKKHSLTLNPEIRIYETPNTLTYEASIQTDILKDYYITMSNIDRSEYYNIKFQKKPFMLWIWISVFFISLGGLLRMFKNEKKIV